MRKVRLTVSRDLRRRKEDGMYGVESYLKKKEGGILPDDGSIPEEMQGRKNPIILLGLYQVMYHEIGEPVQYHGERIPYLGIIEEIEKTLIKKNPDMLKIMLTGLESEFHPPYFTV